MSAGRICSRAVITATPLETVRVAACRMEEFEVGTLVVVDPDQPSIPLGVVTDRDIATRCVAAGRDPSETLVGTIMTQPLRAVDEDMPIEHAIARMADAATRRLVVTGKHGQLVGILSLDDVLDLMIGELEPIRKLLTNQQPLIPV
jgi:CBS domain-containing protein